MRWLALLAIMLAVSAALAGGGVYKAPPPKFLGPNGVECPKCPDPCPPATSCPACVCNPAPSVTVATPAPQLPLPPERPAPWAAPTWFLDAGAQYADGPGVFVGPRRQWPSGVSLALHGIFEWAHDACAPFGAQDEGWHDAAPIHVPGHHAPNRPGVAVMVSVPLRRH